MQNKNNLKLDKAGIRFIENAEGVRLQKYKDVAGYWTIGVGHLIRSWENFDSGITQNQAEELLSSDASGAEKSVNSLVSVCLKHNQFNALVSFVFNVGSTAFANSTLLSVLNKGDYAEAAKQFLRWDVAGGDHVAGLLARRKKEMELFLNV